MEKRLMMFLASLFLCVGMAMAQTQVSGTVTSADDGQPIVGASVLVVGTKTGTVTDLDGKFSLSAPAGAKLQFSYIGMLSRTVKAAPNMNVTLYTDDKSLEEVMVVAYGTQKKSSFTGSAGTVSEKVLETRVVANATNALAGQVSGVQVQNNNGAPGEDAKIRIRGVGSFQSSNTPLYIVDGVPFDGKISSINPNDIASINVLKDAASNAIYGARGANGVVLITTKRGKNGDAKISFDAKWGTNSRAIPQYDIIDNPAEYIETQFKALYNSKAYHGASSADAYAYANKNILDQTNGGLGYQIYTVPQGENLVGTNMKLNPNATLGYSDGQYTYRPDDWYDEAFSSKLRQEYNASVSGSTDRLNYYAGVGYLNDKGIINNSGFERYTGRSNVEYKARKWLTVGTNLSYTYISNKSADGQTADNWGSSGNLFYIVNNMAPVYPLYVRDAQGNIMHNTVTGLPVYDASGNTNFKRPTAVGNAVRDNAYNTTQLYTDLFSGQWYARFFPIEGLSLEANLATTVQNDRDNYLFSPFGSNQDSQGATYVEHDRMVGTNKRFTAQYVKEIFPKNNFTFLVGYEDYRKKLQVIYGQNDHLYNPFIGEASNAGGSEKKIFKSYTNNYMTEGFFGRILYDYDGKYFGQVSYRRDGSSCFTKDNRWGNFGSLSAAWLISKEKFFDVKWVDELKYKISWGKQGNDNVLDVNEKNSVYEHRNYYPYADTYETSYSNGSYSNVLVTKGNKDLTWESSYAFNTGFEFSLLKRRIEGSLEYWSRITADMIYNKPVPASSGITTGSYPINIGDILNNGIELNLTGHVISNKELNWDVNFNMTTLHSEVTSLDPDLEKNGGQKGGGRIIRVGGSHDEAYLKRFAGVDPDNGDALYYVDPDKGDWSTTNDYSKAQLSDCGSVMPKVYGGFGTTLNYKEFDFTAMFSYQLGGKIYDGTYQSFMHTGYSSMAGTNWSKDIRNAWTPENRYTDVPRLDASVNSYQIDSDRFLVSSNFLSLNNITLGYSLPKSLIAKIGISNLRVYVSGDNLAVLSARKGLDPRVNMGLGTSTSGSGAAQSSYSVIRSFIGGIQLSF